MAYYTIKSAYTANSLKIGDVVRIPESTGEMNDTSRGRYSSYILVDKDRYGTGNALFLRYYVLPTSTTNFAKKTKRMNAQGRYEYQGSEMDVYLNGHSSYNSSFLKAAFGSNGMEHVLKNCSMPQTKYNDGNIDRSLTFNRKVFLPNRKELGLTASIQFSYLTGSTLSYFSSTSAAKRKATTYGSATGQEYMLRDISYQLVNWGYRTVEGGDNAGEEKSTFSLDDWLENENGIRPIICINDTCSLEITNGVKWIIPNLPASSSNITGTVPASVNSQTNFTVSWQAGTDSDTSSSNLSYRLERAYNGSSTYSLVGVYTGVTQVTENLPYNKSNTSVTYRVTCYDNYDNGDGTYKTLGTASIHHNKAPVLTGPLSVVGNYKNSTLTIKWNKATDADNNLSKYKLYRVVDGGSKTAVNENISSVLTQITDTSGDWETVVYSLIAVDSDGATSAEIASSTITLVEENTMTLEFTGSSTANYIQKTSSGQDMTDDYAIALFTLTDPDNEGKTYSYTFYTDGYIIIYGNGTTTKNVVIATAFSSNAVSIPVTIPKAVWQKMGNGNHTVKMIVKDSNNMSREVSYTYKKKCNKIEYVTDTYTLPSGATSVPGSFTLNITGNFPTSGANNAISEVKVCRNAGAGTPTEVTLGASDLAKINTGESISFTDSEPSVANFGFYLKIKLQRAAGDTSTSTYYVTSVNGMIGKNIFVSLQSQIDALDTRVSAIE